MEQAAAATATSGGRGAFGRVAVQRQARVSLALAGAFSAAGRRWPP